jgi:hypothetical protein
VSQPSRRHPLRTAETAAEKGPFRFTPAGDLTNNLADKRDEIVPPKMAESLWKASGEQKIVWFDCTHYGAIVYSASALDHLVRHFRAE